MSTIVLGLNFKVWPSWIVLSTFLIFACEETQQNERTEEAQSPKWSDVTLFQVVDLTPTTAVLSWGPALSSVSLKVYDLRLNQEELTSLSGDLLSILFLLLKKVCVMT